MTTTDTGRRVVWKFDLDVMAALQGPVVVEMPQQADILRVDEQYPRNSIRTSVQMWVAVDPDAPLEQRTFQMSGTGGDVPLNAHGDYWDIATLLMRDRDGNAPMVWHVWEVGTRR